MYEVLNTAIMTEDNFKQLVMGEDTAVGFDRKIMVVQVFLDELQATDMQQWDYVKDDYDMLIVHGTEDEIVPIAAVRRFAERNGIEFVTVEDADHRFQCPEHMDEAIRDILAFYAL